MVTYIWYRRWRSAMTFLKTVTVILGDTGNQSKNVEFPFRIKKELLEDEKKNAEKHVRDSEAT